MKNAVKTIFFTLGIILSLVVMAVMVYNGYYAQKNRKAKKQLAEVKTITENGLIFRDLNKNGRLDKYEDYRQDTETRVNDILAQMTIEEKTGLMWHPPIGIGKQGEVLNMPSAEALSMVSSLDVIVNKKINHYNLFKVPGAKHLAEWNNSIQKIAEKTRLGIPLSISSDPRHGITNFIGADMLGGEWSKWPEPIGLAATGDSALVAEFGRIAAREYCAVGIRTALHPMADLATEPRWARINGTFGEDAKLSKKLTAAYVFGFQGDKLGSTSVACMTKHWPGGGPQADGEDAHFNYGAEQSYPGNNFDYHLVPFEGAFEAKTAMIMPYYGVPTGQTSEDVGMSFNKEIITELLRKEYGYEGLICTDWGIIEGFGLFGFEIIEAKCWGVENLSVKERIKKVIDSGVDQFGGNMNTSELLELVKEGKISQARIDESAKRILRVKFELGLFDNPYVDAEQAESIVKNKESIAKGKLAQRKSIVLLKNRNKLLPLKKGVRVYTENIDKKVLTRYAMPTDSLADADFALLRLQTPWEPRNGDMVESFFHQGKLNFEKNEIERIQTIASAKPTIICVYMDRPAVMPEIAEASQALLCDFGTHDDALLDIVFGDFKPTGKLPFEIPSSMQAVENQKEDVPFDSENPLFHFGHGLQY